LPGRVADDASPAALTGLRRLLEELVIDLAVSTMIRRPWSVFLERRPAAYASKFCETRRRDRLGQNAKVIRKCGGWGPSERARNSSQTDEAANCAAYFNCEGIDEPKRCPQARAQACLGLKRQHVVCFTGRTSRMLTWPLPDFLRFRSQPAGFRWR
jgi:hypothetical protein